VVERAAPLEYEDEGVSIKKSPAKTEFPNAPTARIVSANHAAGRTDAAELNFRMVCWFIFLSPAIFDSDWIVLFEKVFFASYVLN
jgi:hypothetical protein